MTDIEKIVTEAFYNPTTGLTRNIATLKKKNPALWGIPAKTIRTILDNNITIYNRNNSKIHAKERIRYRADYVGQLLHADLAFVASPRNTTQQVLIKDENGEDNRYVLVIVDTYSRYVWAYPLKTKSAATVTKKITKTIAFIREFFYGGYAGLRFTVLTDAGTEFSTKALEAIPLVKHKVARVHAALAEAAIYRFRTKLKYHDRGEGPKRKLDNKVFLQLIRSLNLDSSADAIFEKEALPPDPPEPKAPEVGPTFAQGDLVRVKREGQLFEKKSSLSTFGEQVLVVAGSLWFPLDRVWVYFLVTPDGEHLSSRKWVESELSRVPFKLGIAEEQSFTKDEKKLLGL
jgi:transposase InsO family protein